MPHECDLLGDQPVEENRASVIPPAECFDRETGVYILGCKIGHSDNLKNVQLSCFSTETGKIIESCIAKRADQQDESSAIGCWDNALNKTVLECPTGRSDSDEKLRPPLCVSAETGEIIDDCVDKRAESSEDSCALECWDPVKNMSLPCCLVDRSELPPPECMDPTTGKYTVPCAYTKRSRVPPPGCVDPVTGKCIADCCYDKRWEKCFDPVTGKMTCKTPRDEAVTSSPLQW